MIAVYSLKDRNCVGCKRQKEWGCDAERTVKSWDEKGKPREIEWKRPALVPLLIDGEEWFQCPRRPLKDNPLYWNFLLSQFVYYRAGHLPAGPAIQDQPAKLMTLLREINGVIGELQENERSRPKHKGPPGKPPAHLGPSSGGRVTRR